MKDEISQRQLRTVQYQHIDGGIELLGLHGFFKRLPLLPVTQRKKCFAEVELCPTEEQVLAEARRCARCDLEFTQPH